MEVRDFMRKLLIGLLASYVLLQPVQGQYKSYRGTDGRYYDRTHKDYHTWNDRESRAWRRYWEQKHRRQVEWERANARQRREYWAWRHAHMEY
jgi:hypothetical protein